MVKLLKTLICSKKHFIGVHDQMDQKLLRALVNDQNRVIFVNIWMNMAFKYKASRGHPTIESEANTLNNTSAHQDLT